MARKRSNRLFVSLRKMTRNPQKAISSRADGIGETEGKAAMGGGEQAGKRVSFNPKSEIRHQTSNLKHQTSDGCAFAGDPNPGSACVSRADFGFQPK